jgi:hypothetical protein
MKYVVNLMVLYALITLKIIIAIEY